MNRMKSHESPRKPGRNRKGKNASARLRQLAKRNRKVSSKLKNTRDKK